MITQKDLRNLLGATAHDPFGDKIGKVGQVYYDDDTDQPKWITVHTGLFGTNESFVPLQGAQVQDGIVTVGYDKQRIKNAPNVDKDGHLSPEEEVQLYRYYGIGGYDQPGTPDAGTRGRMRLTPGQRRDRDVARGRDDRDDRDVRRRGPYPGSGHLRPDHRHGDDPLGGAVAGGHGDPRDRAGPAAQARGDRAAERYGAGVP